MKEILRLKILLPLLAAVVVAGGCAGYVILINPGSVFVRWALAALPERVTMITLGPYPEDADFLRLENRAQAVKFFRQVLALDPNNPEVKGFLNDAQPP